MLRSAMAFLLVPVKDCLRAGDLVHLVPGYGQVQTILGIIHFWMGEVEGTYPENGGQVESEPRKLLEGTMSKIPVLRFAGEKTRQALLVLPDLRIDRMRQQESIWLTNN